MPQPTRKPRASRAVRRAAQPLGRLQSYSVTNLFDNPEYTYSFDLDSKEPTLLTGVNGTGKSTILRSIDAISTSNWSQLLQMPFASLTLTFDSKREISVKRSSSAITISLTGEESWSFEHSGRTRVGVTEIREVEAELADLEAHLMGRPDVDRRAYEEQRMYIMRRREDLFDRLRASRIHPSALIPEWANHLSDVFPVLFITDQRLVVETDRGSDRVATRADEAARQIAREISTAKAQYANRSQALDRDFPQRVVRAIADPPSVSDEELQRRLDDLSRTREALEAVGLLPMESASEFEGLDLAPPHVRAVINTYADDTERKLAALEPLRIKLQLFSEFLGQHYKRKQIVINPELGFTISVSGTKAPLPPGKLSSGEQQIMVLAHQILFRATPGTLVLIDEPELSLHVLWQASFVQDLAQMGKVNNLSYLLATHSPTLIGGREDLKRSLDVIGGA
jgi:predicted ATPase